MKPLQAKPIGASVLVTLTLMVFVFASCTNAIGCSNSVLLGKWKTEIRNELPSDHETVDGTCRKIGP